MNKNIFILLAVLFFIGGWTFISNTITPTKNSLKPAQNFSYETIDGKKGQLADHQGQFIVLHFWATWCAPCLVEFPALVDMAKQQQDIMVIAAAIDDDEVVKKFLNQKIGTLPDNFLVVMDSDKKISKKTYGTYKLPESFLISRDMKIIRKIAGAYENWATLDIQREYSRFSQ